MSDHTELTTLQQKLNYELLPGLVDCLTKINEINNQLTNWRNSLPNGQTPPELQSRTQNIQYARQNCNNQLQNVIKYVKAILECIEKSCTFIQTEINNSTATSDHLNQWMEAQKRAQYGCNNVPSIEDLQPVAKWSQNITKDLMFLWDACQGLFKVLGELRNFQLHWPNIQDSLDRLYHLIIDLMQEMFRWSFIVVEQPPIVAKPQHTTLSLRLLCAYPEFGLGTVTNRDRQKVTCKIIDEASATNVKALSAASLEMKEMIPTTGSIGKITEESFRYLPEQRMVGVDFVNAKISVEGRQKKGKDAIKKKYYALFTTVIELPSQHRKSEIQIYTLSQPFVYSCHGNQDDKIWPDILWDVAFSTQLNPVPMTGKRSVTWGELEPVLRGVFSKISSNKARTRTLTDTDMLHLKSRFETGKAPNILNNITLGCLIQENLQAVRNGDVFIDCGFSFWDYFYQCADILHPKQGFTKLNELWENNLIYGFVGKTQAEKLLNKHQEEGKHCLLIRYSDRFLSCLTVSCYDPKKGIDHQKPFPHKSIVEKIGFPEIIQSLDAVQGVDYVICGNNSVVEKSQITSLASSLKSFCKMEPEFTEYSDFNLNLSSDTRSATPRPTKIQSRGRKRPSAIHLKREISNSPPYKREDGFSSLDSPESDSLPSGRSSATQEEVSLSNDLSIQTCNPTDLLDWMNYGLDPLNNELYSSTNGPGSSSVAEQQCAGFVPDLSGSFLSRQGFNYGFNPQLPAELESLDLNEFIHAVDMPAQEPSLYCNLECFPGPIEHMQL